MKYPIELSRSSRTPEFRVGDWGRFEMTIGAGRALRFVRQAGLLSELGHSIPTAAETELYRFSLALCAISSVQLEPYRVRRKMQDICPIEKVVGRLKEMGIINDDIPSLQESIGSKQQPGGVLSLVQSEGITDGQNYPQDNHWLPMCPQQGDLRLSGPPSGQDAGGGARTRDRRVPADLRADTLATVPPTPPSER
ncbi:hypothetical protein PoB_000244200 [Plakobranchus ocellatus]|uniref:Uncharacterized protein n=1 Tax=Plakobranchus ocellatus TaxID=259542 RepID=A0AAV3Y1E2_9GAST|nr:hypothetical protein PoB_000244200 [Plakobranchus ocellatus]